MEKQTSVFALPVQNLNEVVERAVFARITTIDSICTVYKTGDKDW
jgi:hypothetical protein